MSSLHSTAFLPVIGAIAGDIIGSPYELKGHRIKTTEFPLFSTESKFTDDSVLTIAVAKWCVMGQSNGLEAIVRELCLRYFDVGFGHSFKEWLRSDNPQPYNSWGNGSAMRVSPVCLTAMSIPHVLDLAEKTAIITHNHRDGVKGAQAVACAIFLATFGFDKESIKLYLEHEFGYDLRRRLSDIRESYEFDASCPGSVPESIISFLESTDFESAVRNAVSLGGDADTQACIAGSIAAAFYKRIPDAIIHEVFDRLPEEFISILHSYSRINPPEERIINVESVTSIEMDCYLRYNFALAGTDSRKVLVPEGIKMSASFYSRNDERERIYFKMLTKRKEVFKWIENNLREKGVIPPDYTEEPISAILLHSSSFVPSGFRILDDQSYIWEEDIEETRKTAVSNNAVVDKSSGLFAWIIATLKRVFLK